MNISVLPLLELQIRELATYNAPIRWDSAILGTPATDVKDGEPMWSMLRGSYQLLTMIAADTDTSKNHETQIEKTRPVISSITKNKVTSPTLRLIERMARSINTTIHSVSWGIPLIFKYSALQHNLMRQQTLQNNINITMGENTKIPVITQKELMVPANLQ